MNRALTVYPQTDQAKIQACLCQQTFLFLYKVPANDNSIPATISNIQFKTPTDICRYSWIAVSVPLGIFGEAVRIINWKQWPSVGAGPQDDGTIARSYYTSNTQYSNAQQHCHFWTWWQRTNVKMPVSEWDLSTTLRSGGTDPPKLHRGKVNPVYVGHRRFHLKLPNLHG